MSDRGPIRACLTAVAFAVACVLAALVTVILVAIVDHLFGLDSELAQDASIVVASLATVACGAWVARRVWLHRLRRDGANAHDSGRRWSGESWSRLEPAPTGARTGPVATGSREVWNSGVGRPARPGYRRPRQAS